jgi:ParB family transcriptional regulator, chromosome partitioning protein
MPPRKKKEGADAAPKAKSAAAKKAPARKKKAPEKIEPVGLAPDALGLPVSDPSIATLAQHVVDAGGAVIGAYRDPLGGHPLLFASLPIEKVEPTSFQRDVSPAHVKKLAVAIGKTRRFLDPVIAIREDDGRFLTPNGNHRLTVMRELGARSIVALVVPERSVAYQILALNIEKAHNLRERAMEVRRMMVDLATWAKGTEKDFELELDEPALVTIGFAYEARPRISGGAYVPVLKKVDDWVPGTLEDAVTERRRRAALVLELDDAVEGAVARLKEKGLTSPYLRAFVVARINPLRFIKGEPPSLDELMATMTKRASGMDAGKISTADLARSGGAPDEE